MSLGGRRRPSGLEIINKNGKTPRGGVNENAFPNAKILSGQSKERILIGQRWCGSKSSMFVCAPQVIRSIIAQQLQPRTCDSERGAERALARRFPLKRAQSFSRSQPAGFSSRKFPPKRQCNSFARERWKTRETINRHARTSFSVSVWSSGKSTRYEQLIAKVAARPALMTSPNGKLSHSIEWFELKMQLGGSSCPARDSIPSNLIRLTRLQSDLPRNPHTRWPS